MKYLFFDIECANCFDKRGKIYSFGYIVADEKLNELPIEDYEYLMDEKYKREKLA